MAMYGKTRTPEAIAKIKKPGVLNPLYGKTYTIEFKLKISDYHTYPVSLYDYNNTYILTFKNNTQLAAFVNVIKQLLLVILYLVNYIIIYIILDVVNTLDLFNFNNRLRPIFNILLFRSPNLLLGILLNILLLVLSFSS